MMQDQPPLETGKDVLFLLTGAWDDAAGGPWLCADCCLMEGALLVNPHWREAITIVRIDYPRPRPEIIALLGEAHQNAPTLILSADTNAHTQVETANDRRFLTDPKAICHQLATTYGGAQPK
ncbi:DUF3088 domain-containing protein [uncultured Maricaulis sp.]|uniref:DUF3088 domain-containing protein n=1 Tax=uncultured Maricaulis sp. TaxID=174710 RepID=UPI0030DBA4A1|tara:strand:+ start:156245 stop:156610 length:366 start_codon:yes stop_codon:yes gene_type:complete